MASLVTGWVLYRCGDWVWDQRYCLGFDTWERKGEETGLGRKINQWCRPNKALANLSGSSEKGTVGQNCPDQNSWAFTHTHTHTHTPLQTQMWSAPGRMCPQAAMLSTAEADPERAVSLRLFADQLFTAGPPAIPYRESWLWHLLTHLTMAFRILGLRP